jgi:hypothetical protein
MLMIWDKVVLPAVSKFESWITPPIRTKHLDCWPKKYWDICDQMMASEFAAIEIKKMLYFYSDLKIYT